MNTKFLVGDVIPKRHFTTTNISLFLYNAAVWNAHRIHYDERYTIEVENHPGIIVDGPLQGDWLTQVAIDWIGQRGVIKEFEYSNRLASVVGEILTGGGEVVSVRENLVSLKLYLKNSAGQIITPGSALFELTVTKLTT